MSENEIFMLNVDPWKSEVIFMNIIIPEILSYMVFKRIPVYMGFSICF